MHQFLLFFLNVFQWENQYLLYGPLLAQVVYSRMYEDGSKSKSSWSLHLLILWNIRCSIFALSSSFSNMLFIGRGRRINRNGVDFKQIDLEWDWYFLPTKSLSSP